MADVFEIAASYRGAAAAAIPLEIGNPGASVEAVLGNPRIQLTGVQRVDLASGLVDTRVIALLAWLGRSHSLVVTALRSDHSYFTRNGNVSNHALGRAADVGAVDGELCAGTRTGACGLLATQLASLSGVFEPTELIYCFDPDGPSSPNGFAAADHCNHVHFGFDD